ncbi:WD repeat-containing protein 89 [Hetaerina americana]|uniref:WD repeat-containing protein 89 n=1 Tax=Hetaerina americana TaxID=62018 RepID=UPI003A7F2310
MCSLDGKCRADGVNEDDSCFQEEMDTAYRIQYSLDCNVTVTNKSTYLLELSGNNNGFVATGLSNHNIIVYDVEKVKAVDTYGHDGGITGLRFSPKNDRLLYSSSLDGSVKLWDIRTSNGEGCVSEFSGKWNNDDGTHTRHGLTAFDVCNRDRIVAAGTESDGVDSFLLFWDVRAPIKPAGGYWESQSEDITQVRFHPNQSDTLASGSMDGLINIFDIRQTCEDDALANSLNTQSTVDRLSWLKNYRACDSGDDCSTDMFLSCVTHAETLQIWQTEEVSQQHDFSRSDLAEALKVTTAEDSYIVDVFFDGEFQDDVLVLGGSLKSECLRILSLRDGELQPWAGLKGSNQVVRCCWGEPKSGLLATGGEGGMLSLWRREGRDEQSMCEDHAEVVDKETHKMRPKKRSKPNVNPY